MHGHHSTDAALLFSRFIYFLASHFTCLLSVCQPISTALMWAVGVTLLLRTLYDIAAPLELRDMRQDERGVASIGLFIGIALLCFIVLRSRAVTVAADPQRMVAMTRLCCGGTGGLLVLRCGMRLIAKWATPQAAFAPYASTASPDFLEYGRAYGRHVRVALFHVLGGGDLLGCVIGVILSYLAVHGIPSAGACVTGYSR